MHISYKRGNVYILYFDGACRGNPGPMAIGATLYKDEIKLDEFSKDIGLGTNNIAEWTALITGLGLAKKHKCKDLEVRGDSQLVIKQITGQWKVNNKKLIPLYQRTKELCRDFDKITFIWIRRDKNSYTNDMIQEKCYNQEKLYK